MFDAKLALIVTVHLMHDSVPKAIKVLHILTGHSLMDCKKFVNETDSIRTKESDDNIRCKEVGILLDEIDSLHRIIQDRITQPDQEVRRLQNYVDGLKADISLRDEDVANIEKRLDKANDTIDNLKGNVSRILSDYSLFSNS